MRQNGFYRQARANDRDAARARAEHEQTQRDAMRARELEARRVEAERVPLTRDDFEGMKAARLGGGWYRIVRVNAKSVSLVVDRNPATGYEAVERFPFAQIREVR